MLDAQTAELVSPQTPVSTQVLLGQSAFTEQAGPFKLFAHFRAAELIPLQRIFATQEPEHVAGFTGAKVPVAAWQLQLIPLQLPICPEQTLPSVHSVSAEQDCPEKPQVDWHFVELLHQPVSQRFPPTRLPLIVWHKLGFPVVASGNKDSYSVGASKPRPQGSYPLAQNCLYPEAAKHPA